MNIAAIRNSALSSIDEKNNLPTWKGGAWPGGSSIGNSGVSGLGVSGQYLQGLINLVSNGNISLIQNGQQITISGSNQNSQIIGSYVSGLGIANNLLTGAVILSGLGSISLSQNGQIIYISGNGGNSQISDYFGVTGIRISGDSISGAISFAQAGNVYLIQNGNNIIISGKESSSTGSLTGIVFGGVTGVGVSGNFTTGGINLLSAGSITLIQNGQNITISGSSTSQGGTVISSTGDGIYISLGNTGGQILNSGAFNAINWNSGIRSGILTFDQNEPSKIYIQTGCSGYYNISAYVNLNNNDLFDNYVWKKNGTNYLTNKSSNIANAYLNDGDYLEFYVNPVYSTSISGNINCDISNIKVISPEFNLPTGSGYLYNDGNGNISWKNQIINLSPLQIPKLIAWFSASSGILNSNNNICSNGEEIFKIKNIKNENDMIFRDNIFSSGIKLFTGTSEYPYPFIHISGKHSFTGIFNPSGYNIYRDYTFVSFSKKNNETGINYLFYTSGVNNSNINNRIVAIPNHSDQTMYFDVGSTAYRLNSIGGSRNNDWNSHYFIKKDSNIKYLLNGNLINYSNNNGYPKIDNGTSIGIWFGFPGIITNNYFSDILFFGKDLNSNDINILEKYFNNY